MHGIDEHIYIINVLGDGSSTVFFDNGFSIGDEEKPLWSGYRRKKLPNPWTCTDPSFMKRPIKDNSYNREGRSMIFCYTPQLCDRAE